MTTLKIIIITNETAAGKAIKSAVTNMGYAIIAVSSNGEAAIEEMKHNLPSLALIDTSLKGEMDAIDTAKAIRDKFELPVIFISADADDDLLTKMMPAEPYGFLLKPLNEKELLAAIKLSVYKHQNDLKIRKEKELFAYLLDSRNTPDCVYVRSDFRLNKIKFENILYVEAKKDYVTIHTLDNQFTTHATMKEMIAFLPKKDFKRIHRGIIVRLDKIFNIKYPHLIIEGKMKTLKIGAKYREDLYNSLNMI